MTYNPTLTGFMVCVDYHDIAAITLPYNAHHFKRMCITTDYDSQKAVREMAWELPNPTGMGIDIIATDLFYANGARFNKWLALEWAIDQLGCRNVGWLCLMDADVLWPQELKVWQRCGDYLAHDMPGSSFTQLPGQLVTPLRRMFSDFGKATFTKEPTPFPGYERYPAQDQWHQYPIHRNVNEWAGYSQIFHTADPYLGHAPWHETDWAHAGGADSFFQLKWPKAFKRRPNWEVLHLGPAGVNWLGRSTMYADGTEHPQARERCSAMGQLWAARRRREAIVRGEGLRGEEAKKQIFAPEKVKGLRVDTYQEEP